MAASLARLLVLKESVGVQQRIGKLGFQQGAAALRMSTKAKYEEKVNVSPDTYARDEEVLDIDVRASWPDTVAVPEGGPRFSCPDFPHPVRNSLMDPDPYRHSMSEPSRYNVGPQGSVVHGKPQLQQHRA